MAASSHSSPTRRRTLLRRPAGSGPGGPLAGRGPRGGGGGGLADGRARGESDGPESRGAGRGSAPCLRVCEVKLAAAVADHERGRDEQAQARAVPPVAELLKEVGERTEQRGGEVHSLCCVLLDRNSLQVLLVHATLLAQILVVCQMSFAVPRPVGDPSEAAQYQGGEPAGSQLNVALQPLRAVLPWPLHGRAGTGIGAATRGPLSPLGHR